MPVSDQQIRDFIAAGHTPQEIADAAAQYGVNIADIARATGQSGQSLIQQANQAGITNQQLAQKGIIAPMDIGTTGNNLANARYAGAISPGVLAAYQASVMGQSDPSAAGYTAADLAEAQKYQQYGYYGPTGSGNALTELRNTGVTSGPLNTNVPWAGRSYAQMAQSQPQVARQGMLGNQQQGYYNQAQRYPMQQQQMYPYQNYGNQGMFGGTATSRMPYTGYQAYQPYQGMNRTQGMFGSPTMNYNLRNQPNRISGGYGVGTAVTPPGYIAPNYTSPSGNTTMSRQPDMAIGGGGTSNYSLTGGRLNQTDSLQPQYTNRNQTPFNQSYNNTGWNPGSQYGQSYNQYVSGNQPQSWSQTNPWSY